MNLFSVCYTPFHKAVRGLGILLFILILGMLIVGLFFLSPTSILYIYYWIGVLVFLLVWAGLAFLEILIIRKHFVRRNDTVFASFLVKTSSHLLKKDPQFFSKSVSALESEQKSSSN
ncbi:MAG: hypothetical protein AABZ60_09660 [Planctomycetota bacterium]